uniref:Plastid transcriptionally active 12 n=1 Tax=Kalanchoe fedtschenkoi TaxID=63787 RepID=A0A7N0RE13_KALFE
MSSLSTAFVYKDGGCRIKVSSRGGLMLKNSQFKDFQTLFLGSLPARVLQLSVGFKPSRQSHSAPCIKCENKKGKDEPFKEVSVERAPYYSYLDSTSGQIEPASGARASIPTEEYWPEGTASRVRAARAPDPTGKSEGVPSFGKSPGSRRKKNKTATIATVSSQATVELSDNVATDSSEEDEEKEKEGEYRAGESSDNHILEKSRDLSSEYVIYQTKSEKKEVMEFEVNKEIGLPHPFIDPKVKKPKPEQLSSDELWWNWRKPDQEQWSRWQRRRPDSETVFLKAMAETGQVKLYGEEPTLTETSLYRARRHIFKEERLRAERDRLARDGPMAYYSEWVKAWKRDTSREAVQKHFEETGEDENTQLIEMFQYQTDREYRTMVGTDVRIPRDPLAMRMREDQIKQIWGGDPVYPTVNYIQDPDEVIDYRGPDFHEPTPDMLDYLKEHGKIISREELDKILSKEKMEEIEISDVDDAMARAVDIGEDEDEGEDSDVEVDEDADGKLPRNWSVLKSTPELRKSKDKPKKKNAPLSLDDAVDESENLTDFLMDFEEDE